MGLKSEEFYSFSVKRNCNVKTFSIAEKCQVDSLLLRWLQCVFPILSHHSSPTEKVMKAMLVAREF